MGKYYNNSLFFDLIEQSASIKYTTKKESKESKEEEEYFISTQELAIKYMMTQLKYTYSTNIKMDALLDHLNKDFLPNCGTDGLYAPKIAMLGHMTNKLLTCYFGIRPYDKRDNLANKRLDTAGPLLTKIYRSYFLDLIDEIKKE